MALYNTAEFACRHGYRLVGSRWRVCTQSGKWTGLPAKCEGTQRVPTLNAKALLALAPGLHVEVNMIES